MALLIQFLGQIRLFVKTQNGDELRNWLLVEPSASQTYHNLALEIRTSFQQGTQSLEDTIEHCLPEDDDVPEGEATPWPGFVTFMTEYLIFWRDVDFNDLLRSHSLLSGLVKYFAHPVSSSKADAANLSQNQSLTARVDSGGMLLHTAMSLCETLSRVTMMVHRRPDLATSLHAGDPEDDKSIAETSAEIIQKIFTTCLTDRASGRFSKPEGKKIGVYMFANLVLKLLFACRRTHLAKQIFTNISSNSPPLSLYPAAQRVTFLYYLGRFNLSNCHFVRAIHCLERAYLETPAQLASHRQTILTYLIPANMILGRLPSLKLLSRPEAARALTSVFSPLCTAIRKGDFPLFQQTLASHEDWLFDKGLLILLTYRLRPLLWRSMARRTFLLTFTSEGFDDDPRATARRAATLDLADLFTVATYQQRRLQGWHQVPGRARPSHVSAVFMQAVANDAPSILVPPDGGPRKLRPNEGLIWGNAEVTPSDIEMMVASLVTQGFMNGYIAHSSARFAIMGAAKAGGPLAAGFPTPWRAITDRHYDDGDVDLDEVPGWVKG